MSDAEYVALLAECTHYNCARRLFSGAPWKLLKSRVGCFWVLPGCILAAGSCSFKVGTTVLLYGRSCNNSMALRANVSKHSSSGLGNFLRQFPAASYLKQRCTKNRCSSTVYLSPGMLLQHWKTKKCIYQQKNSMIHSASLLSSTAKVTLSFKNSAREPTWPRSLALHSPDLRAHFLTFICGEV